MEALIHQNSGQQRAGDAGQVERSQRGQACDHLESAANCEPPAPVTVTWRTVLGRRLGKLVLAICPRGREECDNAHCAFRPLCMCARRDLQNAGKLETRIWVTVGVCGVVMILVAFGWAMS